METVATVTALLAVVLNTLAGGLGAWRWWRVETSPWFWRLLRAAQVVLGLEVALGGAMLLAGRESPDDLHLVYGLLPLGVSFAAEQLRVSAAETVLDSRGHESAHAVGRAPEAEQRAVVAAIMRREIVVMTVTALVIVALALRAMDA